jgi:hypothetical protein
LTFKVLKIIVSGQKNTGTTTIDQLVLAKMQSLDKKTAQVG